MSQKKKINKYQKLAQKRVRKQLKSLDAGKVKISLEMDNYQQLGFTLQSILKVCQSSLFAHEVNSEYHEFLDIVNILDLACKLVPVEELEQINMVKD